MLAYLKGNFTLKTPTFIYVEAHGVGYEVQVSLNTYSKIQNLQEGILYTHLIIREDAHVLYGFFEKSEKEVFQQLISVSGVGAATARVMLSSLQANELINAILSGNESLLESIKGIGKKTAQRIVLELRDKFSKSITDGNISTLMQRHRARLHATHLRPRRPSAWRVRRASADNPRRGWRCVASPNVDRPSD